MELRNELWERSPPASDLVETDFKLKAPFGEVARG